MSELSLPLPTRSALRPARLCSDAQLARRAAAGDRRAFEAIFERHHQAVFRYCRSILGNGEDAADALQNTMAAVLRSLEGETREIALKAWIFRIAHNEALSIVRRRRPQVELDDAQACPRPSLESDVLASERLGQLVCDVQALPERQRGALVMRELNDLGYDEIAAVFGVSEGAARQTVHEARTALHDLEQGRAMPCAEVLELIGERDGRLLRGRKVRAHLRACSSCEGFRLAIGERRVALGLAAPPLAAPLAGAILHGLLGGGGGGAAIAAAGAGASGAGAMSAASAAPLTGTAVATGIAAKAAAVTGTKAIAALVAAATLTGGAVVAEQRISDDRRGAPAGQSNSPALAQPASTRAGGAGTTGPAAGASAGAANNLKAAKATALAKARRKAKAAAGRDAATLGANRASAAAERAAKRASAGAGRAKDPAKRKAGVATAGKTPPASSATRGRPSTPPPAMSRKAPNAKPSASSGIVQQPKVPKAKAPGELSGG